MLGGLLKGLFMISGFLILSAIYGKDSEKKVSTGKGILMSVIFSFWIIFTMLAFTENIAFGIISLLSFPLICVCWGINVRKSANAKTQTDLEQIEKRIATLKQTYQNSLKDIENYNPEHVKQSYMQGSISRKTFDKFVDSYKATKLIIESSPKELEVLEQKRLELLNK